MSGWQTIDPTPIRHYLDLGGVAVGAISGAIAAGRRHLDLVGVAVVATVTAIGGGTLRDLLLNRAQVFWLSDPSYLITILCAAGGTIIYTKFKAPPERALLIADAFALGLFSVAGAQIAEGVGLHPLYAVVMGTITAVAGGVLRDVLLAAVPMVMQSGYLYATTAIAGAVLYVGMRALYIDYLAAAAGGVALTVVLRVLAIVYGIRLPVYRLGEPGNENPKNPE